MSMYELQKLIPSGVRVFQRGDLFTVRKHGKCIWSGHGVDALEEYIVLHASKYGEDF